MSRQLRPSPNCLNCGHEIASRYCPECGQENTTYKVSLGRLLGDLFEELFQLESRLWRSLWDLVRHPGRLTREYNAGRRVRYTSPLRLYLLTSVVYFFVVAVLPRSDSMIRADFRDATKDAKTDLTHLPPPKNALERRIRERLGVLEKIDPVETSRRAREILVQNTPRVMLILLPLFALLLQILFRRRLYVEHLVFVLHTHAVAFLFMTVGVLPRRTQTMQFLALAVAVVWMFIALKRVYEQSWLRVAWKTLVLVFLYSILLSLGIAGAVLGGLLLF